jgi:protein-L-isoaspartate(D-aspartate) O-methyltransferase
MKQRPAFPARLDLKPEAPKRGASSVPPATPARPATPQTAAPALTPAGTTRRTSTTGARSTARAVSTVPPVQGLGLDSQAVRLRMVQRLTQDGIEDDMVLKAMATIERHRFVDSALVNQAYEDTSLPIGLGQTISKPSVVARMIALLRQGHNLRINGKLGRVLEIGTGCGYQAAVLSRVAKEVYSIERLRGLHERAVDNLRHLRQPNLHLILGDGMLGYAQGAPYAGIIAAAGGDALPQAWLDQLAVGGRLVAPMVSSQGQQSLMVIERTEQGFEQQTLEMVHFVPLKSGIA